MRKTGQKKKTDLQSLNAYEVAAKRLASGARTAYELKTWLLERGFDREEAEQAVQAMVTDGYVDDCRYAADFCRYAAGKGWGPGRIRQELWRRGVSSEAIATGEARFRAETGDGAEEDTGEEEAKRALAVLRKMAGPTDIEEDGRFSEKMRARMSRRLYSYGYASGTIYAAIHALEEEFTETSQ